MSVNVSEIENPENSNSEKKSLELKQKWLTLLQKLIPIANSLSAKIITYAFFGTLVSIWLALFCYRLNHLSITYTVIISAISFIPSAFLYLYYFKLQEVIELTQNVHDISDNSHFSYQSFADEVKKIKEIKPEHINSFNIIKQGKRIYEFINLIKSAKGMLSQYVNVAFLVSPFTLFLLTGALLGFGLLFLVFVITLFMAIF